MAKVKKQTSIPGTEPKSIKEVDVAAEQYVEERDARMRLTEKEVEARDALVRVMQKHKLSIYRDESAEPPLLVTLTEGEAKVKVQKVKDGEDEP